MPERSFALEVARTLYALEPLSGEPLEQYTYDWRGIYRVHDPERGTWVLRMIQRPEELGRLTHVASMLEWLAARHYPAPRVRPTATRQLVGMIDGWCVLAVSYIDGSVLTAEPGELTLLAQALGRLHALDAAALPSDRTDRCHPDTIVSAARQLASYAARIPPEFSGLAAQLRASMEILAQHSRSPLSLTHGDCWYMNAIKSGEGSVTLIDWDNIGLGLPLLDLGGLLLTAHFELHRPLQLEPSEAKVAAIVRGYQQARPIPAHERAHLAHAMRFLLAFQLGSYLADPARVQHPEFPFVLRKLQARHGAAQPIADIAARLLYSKV